MRKSITACWHKDASGKVDPHLFVGKKFFHPKTGRLYEVTGYRLDSERELWVLDYSQVGKEHSDQNGINRFSHTIEDFTREGRFLEVKK